MYSKYSKETEIGRSHNRITIIDYYPARSRSKDQIRSEVLLRCFCGEEWITTHINFTANYVKQCKACDDLQRRKYFVETEVGRRFGRWIVLEFYPSTSKNNPAKALVVCDCGETKPRTLLYNTLVRGLSKSCDCLMIEKIKEANITHDLSETIFYRTAVGAFGRCKPNYKKHEYYYDRGITFNFESIYACAKYIKDNLGIRPKGYSLDRINNNGNYEPGNIRWASLEEQRKNQRDPIKNNIVDDMKKKIEELEKTILELKSYNKFEIEDVIWY